MARFYAPVQFVDDAEVFWAIYRSSTCAVQRRRAQFFALLAEGYSEAEVLEITRYTPSTARLVVKRYHALGLEGLQDGRGHNPGAPRVLTADEQQRLAAQLHQDFEQSQVCSGKQVRDWIQAQFGKTVHLARSYEFLRAAGFCLQTPRPRHIRGDETRKEAFKTKS